VFYFPFIYYVVTTITIMYNTILVEKRTNLNQKKTKVVNSTSSSDKDILYSLVDKAYYVDGIHHKIDNNLCMDNTDF
jgi:hypothetical protein